MILNGPGISYTEPDIGAEFVPPLPEHPREKIVKLCEHCTNRLLHRDELLGYEYWSFAEAATDEQADVLLKMKMRRPYTLAEMVKLTGMPEPEIEKMLDDMSYTGLLEYNWENPTRTKQWVLPMLVPGSAEFLNMRVGQLDEHPVFAKFFEQASKGPLSKATPMVPPGGAGIGMHVSRPSMLRARRCLSSISSIGWTSMTASTLPRPAAVVQAARFWARAAETTRMTGALLWATWPIT